MIDSDKLKDLIKNRKWFRIGARGICIECRPSLLVSLWVISIPRAFVELAVADIDILDDDIAYDLTVDINGKGEYYSIADLKPYDKLTVIQ